MHRDPTIEELLGEDFGPHTKIVSVQEVLDYARTSGSHLIVNHKQMTTPEAAEWLEKAGVIRLGMYAGRPGRPAKLGEVSWGTALFTADGTPVIITKKQSRYSPQGGVEWHPILTRYPNTAWAIFSLFNNEKPTDIVAHGKYRFAREANGQEVYRSKEYTNPNYAQAWKEFRNAQRAVYKKIGPFNHIFLEDVGGHGRYPGLLFFGTGS